VNCKEDTGATDTEIMFCVARALGLEQVLTYEKNSYWTGFRRAVQDYYSNISTLQFENPAFDPSTIAAFVAPEIEVGVGEFIAAGYLARAMAAVVTIIKGSRILRGLLITTVLFMVQVIVETQLQSDVQSVVDLAAELKERDKDKKKKRCNCKFNQR
jgi:hypothetical protein